MDYLRDGELESVPWGYPDLMTTAIDKLDATCSTGKLALPSATHNSRYVWRSQTLRTLQATERWVTFRSSRDS